MSSSPSASESRATKCAHVAPYMLPDGEKRCLAHERSCPDVLFVYSAQHGYGIPIRDGGTSFVSISHCPFCGAALEEKPSRDADKVAASAAAIDFEEEVAVALDVIRNDEEATAGPWHMQMDGLTLRTTDIDAETRGPKVAVTTSQELSARAQVANASLIETYRSAAPRLARSFIAIVRTIRDLLDVPRETIETFDRKARSLRELAAGNRAFDTESNLAAGACRAEAERLEGKASTYEYEARALEKRLRIFDDVAQRVRAERLQRPLKKPLTFERAQRKIGKIIKRCHRDDCAGPHFPCDACSHLAEWVMRVASGAPRFSGMFPGDVEEMVARTIFEHEGGCARAEDVNVLGKERPLWSLPKNVVVLGEHDPSLAQWQRDNYHFQARAVLRVLNAWAAGAVGYRARQPTTAETQAHEALGGLWQGWVGDPQKPPEFWYLPENDLERLHLWRPVLPNGTPVGWPEVAAESKETSP